MGYLEDIDPTIQNHLLNLVDSNGTINATGHSWAQMGSIDRVEYRVDSGEWIETEYSATPSELGPLAPFQWHVILNPHKIGSGPHEIEVRAVSDSGYSLPVLATVHGLGGEKGSISISPAAIAVVVGAFVIWVAALFLIRHKSDGEIESMISKLTKGPTSSIDDGVLVAEFVDETGP